MNLRYEMKAEVIVDGGVVLKLRDPHQTDLAALRSSTARWLLSIYGPGVVYSDGWRFIHSAGPHGLRGRRWPYPPSAKWEMSGPCDATISLIVAPTPYALPPFAPVRPSLMLYQPRLTFAEGEWLALQALARRPWLIVLVYTLLLAWVYLGGPHG